MGDANISQLIDLITKFCTNSTRMKDSIIVAIKENTEEFIDTIYAIKADIQICVLHDVQCVYSIKHVCNKGIYSIIQVVIYGLLINNCIHSAKKLFNLLQFLHMDDSNIEIFKHRFIFELITRYNNSNVQFIKQLSSFLVLTNAKANIIDHCITLYTLNINKVFSYEDLYYITKEISKIISSKDINYTITKIICLNLFGFELDGENLTKPSNYLLDFIAKHKIKLAIMNIDLAHRIQQLCIQSNCKLLFNVENYPSDVEQQRRNIVQFIPDEFVSQFCKSINIVDLEDFCKHGVKFETMQYIIHSLLT